MSEQLSKVREMQNWENWEDDGTIPIIVNHIVNEDRNIRLNTSVDGNLTHHSTNYR